MRTRFSVYTVWLVLFLLAFSLKAWCQSSHSGILGKEDSVYSRILTETRPFFISLPDSYEKDDFYINKRYPVLILLDADTHFRYAASMIQFASAGENEQIPEMIVVGVRNTNRTRDMTSNLLTRPNHFLDFLEQELLPHIDQRYRTAPYRVLAGHSLAGLFTLNVLLSQSRFNAYIAIDPTLTWNNNYLPQKTDSLLKATTFNAKKLYLSQASNPFEPGQYTGARGRAFEAFKLSLAQNSAKQLQHQYAYYEQETHFSVPFRSLYDGLFFVFDRYSFPFQTFLSQGSEGVNRHYQQFITQLGINLPPPGKVINQAGLFLVHNQNQVDKGLALLRLNEQYYPNSPTVHRSLGRAYQAKGDKNRAIQCYRNVLAINTTDEQAIKAIRELTSQN